MNTGVRLAVLAPAMAMVVSGSFSQCSDCGATYAVPGDSCAARFENLIALDHSRREPWGSRHGIAFAVYALQHPDLFPTATQEQSWRVLYRVYVEGDDPARVLRALAGRELSASDAWNVPPVPPTPSGAPVITIADLGEFDAPDYPRLLDAWARAAMSWRGANVVSQQPPPSPR